MGIDIDRLDLPILRASDEDLPVLALGAGPQHERAKVEVYPGWRNYASQRHVRGIAVDPARGDIWLATGGGVLRWLPGMDRYTLYASEHGLPGNKIKAIALTAAEDGGRQVWAAHEINGLYFFDGECWRQYSGVVDERISCLSTDDTGRLWMATSSGVYGIDGILSGPAATYPYAGDPPRALASGSNGDIWFCNSLGVHRWRPHNGSWTRYDSRPDVLALTLQAGRLWLGTMRGLFCVDLIANTQQRAENWPAGEVTALAPAENGVWTAGQGGIGLATEAGWERIGASVFEARITSLAIRDGGELWIGAQNGLRCIGPDGVRSHLTDASPGVINRTESAPPLGNSIQALAVQPNGDALWIGTPRGLFRMRLDNETWKFFTRPSLRDIRALEVVGADEALAASWHGGLQRVKGRDVTPVGLDSILALVAGAENYWAGGWQGVYRCDERAWSLALPARRLPANGWVQALAQTQARSVWIGTSAGLFFYEAEFDTLTPAGEELRRADVRTLLTVPDAQSEQVFIGTSRGLYFSDNRRLSPAPGLNGRTVTALACDASAGVLWAGTENGLARLEKADGQWEVQNEMTARDSGLGADRVTALAFNRKNDGQIDLWVGTSCGLSRYTY